MGIESGDSTEQKIPPRLPGWAGIWIIALSVSSGVLLIYHALFGVFYQRLWIDEVVNLMRTWVPGKMWLQQVNVLEIVYLAPIRLNDGSNPEHLLRLYRAATAGICVGVLVPWMGKLLRDKCGWSLGLLVAVGLLSTHWLSSFYYLARPTGPAALGLAIWLLGPSGLLGRFVSFVAILAQPFAHGFYLFHYFWGTNDWRRKAGGIAVAVLASGPILFGLVDGRSIMMNHAFVRQLAQEFATHNKVNFLAFVGSPLLMISLVPLVIIWGLHWKTRKQNRWDLLVIPAYLVLLQLMDVLALPVWTRYVFPVVVWTWVVLLPQVYMYLLCHSGWLVALLLAVTAQASVLPPTDAHWEAVRYHAVGLPPLRTDLCHRVHVESESALATLVAMDLLLAEGIWKLDSTGTGNNVVRGCGLSLTTDIWAVSSRGGESRFSRLLKSPGSDLPACVLAFDSDLGARYESKRCVIQ